jgi:chemotaxis family two-component system response regulator Rcp1
MFRILVVDDDPASGYLLQTLMKDLQRPHEFYVVKDGLDALDFLHHRGAYHDIPLPNLILLDFHMPRLNGPETLAAIKSHPELRFIPVIMLSTSDRPEDVRRSYEAQANCYVQKPTDLDRSVKLVRAVEAFWIEFALPAPSAGRNGEDSRRAGSAGPRENHTGPAIAPLAGEARSRTMVCVEHSRLLDVFGAAVQDLLHLHEQQFSAIVEGDTECNRFDLLIHMANEQKQAAKYAFLRHVESHGCSNTDAVNQTRT